MVNSGPPPSTSPYRAISSARIAAFAPTSFDEYVTGR